MTMLAILSLLLPCSLAVPISTTQEDHSLELSLIHINDFHAHFEQTNKYTSRCRQQDSDSDDCYGGVARLYQKALEIRTKDPDTIFLNAGDFYQGTSWYTKLKYGPMIDFGNKLSYTAMGLGNHDFDDQIEGFTPFAAKAEFPLLAANIVLNSDSGLEEGKHFNKSTVVMVKGRKVGIVGYVTTSTIYNFPDRDVEFVEEIETVGAEARKLKEEGVEIIIALGHSGYEKDIELAEKIPELDIVVGGHSHTFLYTKKNPEDPYPSIETPRGEYPTYVTNLNSSKVIPVVQAYCYTKYLGHLQLNFSAEGDLLTPVEGTGVSFAEPILLDSSIDQNPEVLEMMKPFQANLTEFYTVIGENKIILEENAPSEESNIGDVIAEAMAGVYNDTRISFTNNGGIRSTIDVGEVMYDDILYVLPFDNTVDLVTMKGQGIKDALERASEGIDPENVNKYPGFGYQISGLRVVIEARADNVGSRVTSLKVEGEDGSYSDIDLEAEYNLALPSFLAGGGTKNQKQMRGIFDDNILTHDVGEVYIYEAMRDFVKQNTPLEREVDGRLVVTGENTTDTGAASLPILSMTVWPILSLTLLLHWSSIHL